MSSAVGSKVFNLLLPKYGVVPVAITLHLEAASTADTTGEPVRIEVLGGERVAPLAMGLASLLSPRTLASTPVLKHGYGL